MGVRVWVCHQDLGLGIRVMVRVRVKIHVHGGAFCGNTLELHLGSGDHDWSVTRRLFGVRAWV